MTAKELKEILNTVPDETPIVVFKSNMETLERWSE